MSKPIEWKSGVEDWTAPDYFDLAEEKEYRFIPLFLKQLMPAQTQRTRLTMTGWFLVIVAMGIGSAAYNTASNILFMTLSLVLSSLILSGVLSLINFRKLDWEVIAPKQIRAGETGIVSVKIQNRKRWIPTMSLCCLLEPNKGSQPEELYLSRALGPKEQTELDCSVKAIQRGRQRLRLVGLKSEFPFGFLSKLLEINLSVPFIVWPAAVDFSFSRLVGGRRIMSGETRKQAGVGTDLLNIRPYVQGDPPRLLHWKATARLGKPMTRQLAQEGDSGYWIEVNPLAQDWPSDSFERMCSVVCSLAHALYAQGRLYGIHVISREYIPVKNLGDLEDCFNQIAVLDPVESDLQASRLQRPNRIHFHADAAGEVGIYIDENRAGQTES